MKKKLNNLYLMYVNDFISTNGFANYLEVTEEKANRIIDLGRKIHHKECTKWNVK
jgi:hypothetical protein